MSLLDMLRRGMMPGQQPPQQMQSPQQMPIDPGMSYSPPRPVQAPTPRNKWSLWDQIQENVAPYPKEYDGLLSERDVAGARKQGMLSAGASLLEDSQPTVGGRDFLSSVGHALNVGRDGYQGAIQNKVAGIAQTQDMAGNRQNMDFNRMKMDALGGEQTRQRMMQSARADIMSRHGQPDTSDPQGMATWIDQVMPELIKVGDEETVARLSEIRKSIQPKESKSLMSLNLGDKMQLVDPHTGDVVQERPIAQSPNNAATINLREQMTPVQSARAEQAIVSRFDSQTKDYTKAHEAWGQVDHVVKRALAGNHSPDDVVQLIDGISRLNNPGAVVRTGTVQLQLDKIGSMRQKAEMKYGQAANGMWPKEIVQGIARAAQAIAKEHATQYNDLRKRAKRRGEHSGITYMDDVLPNVWGTGDSQIPTEGGNGGPFDDVGGASGTSARPPLESLYRGQ